MRFHPREEAAYAHGESLLDGPRFLWRDLWPSLIIVGVFAVVVVYRGALLGP